MGGLDCVSCVSDGLYVCSLVTLERLLYCDAVFHPYPYVLRFVWVPTSERAELRKLVPFLSSQPPRLDHAINVSVNVYHTESAREPRPQQVSRAGAAPSGAAERRRLRCGLLLSRTAIDATTAVRRCDTASLPHGSTCHCVWTNWNVLWSVETPRPVADREAIWDISRVSRRRRRRRRGRGCCPRHRWRRSGWRSEGLQGGRRKRRAAARAR